MEASQWMRKTNLVNVFNGLEASSALDVYMSTVFAKEVGGVWDNVAIVDSTI